MLSKLPIRANQRHRIVQHSLLAAGESLFCPTRGQKMALSETGPLGTADYLRIAVG
jgi:hypothetical protein